MEELSTLGAKIVNIETDRKTTKDEVKHKKPNIKFK